MRTRQSALVLICLLTVGLAGAPAPPSVAAASAAAAPAAPAAARPVGKQLARPAAQAARPRRFWTHDKHLYTSNWYAGAHRKMVPFGCTAAPYYAPDPACPRHQGFHHGLDVAMRCGTRLYAGLRGTVVRPDPAGALGPAYGPEAFRLRNGRLGLDFVIGHVLRVYVRPGDHVRRGTLMARASDQGAPDGCHLHFEVRPSGGSYSDAVFPTRYLHLHRRQAGARPAR